MHREEKDAEHMIHAQVQKTEKLLYNDQKYPEQVLPSFSNTQSEVLKNIKN